MSYDLTIWKCGTEGQECDPRVIGASIQADKPHWSLERFDAQQTKALIWERLGLVSGDDAPMTCEVCDFTGQKANWLILNMSGNFAVDAVPRIVELAEELGLSVYDPQAVSINGKRWCPPSPKPPEEGWKLMLELGGDKMIYDPSDKVLVKEVRKISPWKGRVFAVLTRSEGSFIQAGGAGVACVLERLDKGPAKLIFGRTRDRLFRACQDNPSFRTADGTALRLGTVDVVMGQNDWFTNEQVAEAFQAFARATPFPDYIRWSETPLRDKSTLKFSDTAKR